MVLSTPHAAIWGFTTLDMGYISPSYSRHYYSMVLDCFDIIVWIGIGGPLYVIWMIDRWAWLAHRMRVYCFHRFFGVLSLFRVYTHNY